jgi:hypothetical protein
MNARIAAIVVAALLVLGGGALCLQQQGAPGSPPGPRSSVSRCCRGSRPRT